MACPRGNSRLSGGMTLSLKFDQALAYAAKVHRGQTRKGTSIPMISHLLAVTAIVLEHGGNETEAIGALLHDAAEDAGGRRTLAAIKRKFGTRVAAIVEGCSDTFESPKPAWLKRKTDYLHHLKTASASVQLVSAADKLHNLQSIAADYREIGEALWGRFAPPRPARCGIIASWPGSTSGPVYAQLSSSALRAG